MKSNFIEIFNQIWEWVVGAIALTSLRTKLGRWAFKKLANALAKPIYDLLIRKGYIKLKTTQAKKAEENLKNAKTKSDIDARVDELH